jgi:ubiquinone/menaquinone biosynthesis C-methylase UbiE
MTMKGHKWFAAIYDKMSASEERKFLGAIREEMVGGVTGDVLEVGAGTGANFKYYKNGARVVAIEPDPYMMIRARKRAAEAMIKIDLQQIAAEALPFPDASFDYVIDTLVLCSVKDPRVVLAELKRVLKPSGELRIYEHVRYKNPIGALSQDIISPAWHWSGAGCHPNRDTERLIHEAGFELTSRQIRKDVAPIPPMLFVRPHLQAVARRRM